MLVAVPAMATVVTYTATDANILSMVSPNVNVHNSDYTSIGDSLTSWFLLKFGGISVPVGSIVNSATISVYGNTWDPNLEQVEIRRVTRDWNPGTGMWTQAQEGEVTGAWAKYLVDPWQVAGALGATDSAASVDPIVIWPEAWGWQNHNVTASTQALVNSGVNYGWVFHSVNAYPNPFGVIRFVDGVYPTLTVDYTAVPEPGSLLAMAGGLIGLVGYARRRRS